MSQHQSSLWDEVLEDPFAALLMIVVGGALLVGSLPMWVSGVTDWCIAHHILVADSDHPFLVLPGAGGAGLDIRRVVIAAAAILAVGALAFFPLRARLRREL